MSMTTFELAERLARRLKKGSLSALSVAAVQDIVEAINTGLQECYELLPSWQRRTTLSVELPAPATISTAATNGAVAVTAATFSAAQIGRSVVLATDPNWNQVASTAALLDKFQGTTGTVAGTVYGDAIYNSLAYLDGFAGHPRFADDARQELLPFNARLAGLAGASGLPQYYWTEPAAASLGTSPAVYLRVYPAPSRAYVLRVEAEFRPALISYTNLHQASTIPLADQLLHRALIPLCEVRLLRSPEWAADGKARLVLTDAEGARSFLTNQRASAALPANRIFTPAGY